MMTAPSYSVQRSSLAKQIGLGMVVESLMTDLHTSHADPIPNVPKRARRNNLSANVRRDEGDGLNLDAIILNLEGRSYL